MNPNKRTDRFNELMVAAGLVVTIVLFNVAIQSKESILANGELVLLEMTPVDPRAPFQGDYIDIDFKGLQGVSVDSIPKKGFCILQQQGERVYKPVRFQATLLPKDDNEKAIRYNANRWGIEIGSSTYYFQEGKAALYDSAHYAGYRIDPAGKSILVGLYDEKRQRIP